MRTSHKKAYGIYHWDTFDNETFLVGEADTLLQAQAQVGKRYGDRINSNGADVVEIVDREVSVLQRFNVG